MFLAHSEQHGHYVRRHMSANLSDDHFTVDTCIESPRCTHQTHTLLLITS